MFRQVDGVAMGSPLGPILADIFMAKLENGKFKEFISQFEVYLRYMDDTFIICDPSIDINTIITNFNSAHDVIQFTHEVEQNNPLSFLDALLIRREDGCLGRQVYRKPTWMGQYTPFYGFVPLRFKRNLIRCLYLRAKRICTIDAISVELEFLRQTLLLNGYPEGFLFNCMKEISPRTVNYTANKKILHVHLRFKGDTLNEIITMNLDKVIRRTFPAAQLKISYATHPILPQHVKDKLPDWTTAMYVYKFDCSCGASYLGRTTRRLSARIKEHYPAWLINGRAGNIRSAIVQHLVDSGHRINPDQAFSVYYQVSSNLTRPVKFRTLCTAETVVHTYPEASLMYSEANLPPLIPPMA